MATSRGAAEAAERDGVLHALDEGRAAVAFDRLGQDVAGLDAVDGDAVAGEFQRGRADEAVDAGLGRRIVAMAGAGDMRAGDRRGEQHAAGALRLHRHQRGARGVEGAAQIDRHDAVPVVRAGVLDQLPGIDAGVLDDDVEPAEAVERKRHGGLGVGHLRDVGGDEGGAEFAGGRLAGLQPPCRRAPAARPPRRSAAAMPLPMPRAAPTISATLPASRPVMRASAGSSA